VIASPLLRKLKSIAGSENVFFDPADLTSYSYDSSSFSAFPQAVILPRDTETISDLMRFAFNEGISVFVRGAGTGTTGASVPVQARPDSKGIVLSMTRMNAIRRIELQDMMAEVEPGVITGDLQKATSKVGLFYPPDPASLKVCTIGGNVATGAGGARAVKYGVTRDYVIAIEAVLPSGDIIQTGARTAKGVVGYDLTRLLVGSEGTLALFSRIWLKLVPLPRDVGTVLCFFSSDEDAISAISTIFSAGVLPRCAEFMDALSLRCLVLANPGLSIPVGAGSAVLIEVDGTEEAVTTEIGTVMSEVKGVALQVWHAVDSLEADAMWRLRRGLSPAIKQLGFPDKISEDICVPRHNLAQVLKRIRAIADETAVTILSFGHAGDGNLHVNLLYDKNRKTDIERVEIAVGAVMRASIELGGTISGEHGVGLSKKQFVGWELSQEAISIMKGIKKVFDPKGILNPGKVF